MSTSIKTVRRLSSSDVAVKTSIPLLSALVLAFLLVSCGGGGGGAATGGGATGTQQYFSIAPSPGSLVTSPGSTFSVTLNASNYLSGTPAVTSVHAPAGFTVTTPLPLSLAGGTAITFQVASTLQVGTYTLVLNGQAGPATGTADISAQVQAKPGPFSFAGGTAEIGVPFGGSGHAQVTGVWNYPDDYDVQLSVSGLPSGTTATVSPEIIFPGQPATVTITAASKAPETQNAVVTLTGTPLAPVATASTNFLVDVTEPPGSLPDNRTDYVSTEGTPHAAVYDPLHRLIFASNEFWNRVDVISTVTHAIVTRIPIPDPRGIDITQNDSTVWVGTGSRQMFSIDTSNMSVQRYLLPEGNPPSVVGASWEASRVLVLGDGTIMVVLGSDIAIWTPATNLITFSTLPGIGGGYGVQRSGNGERVYFFSGDSDGSAFYYDVGTQTFSGVVQIGSYILDAAVNNDGSQFYACDLQNGPNMYDSNFNPIGPVSGCGGASPFGGGSVFSADGQYFYQEFPSALPPGPLIVKLDASTLNILSVAPAMPMIPVSTTQFPSYDIPVPFGVDSTGMIFGIQDWGIAFDDSAFAQNYSAAQPATPTYLQHMHPYFGPLSGGTTSGGFGNAFSLTPDVWYGANRGMAQLGSAGTLSITSPPANAPGPVNVKMLFPDGIEVFDPLFFSYGPDLQYALISGASPEGNTTGQVVGFGLPLDATGTLTIGGANATLQAPTPTSYYPGDLLPLAGTPFPNKTLTYTVPPGSPGWADITVSTTDGTSTLPKSFFYAKSVTDYPSADSFTAVLYDAGRQQLYLSAGDHIDVFSLVSNQFTSPLNPPAIGTSKLFAGLALSPDGSTLLATDLADGSLAVINPDSPSSSYAIPIAPVQTVTSGTSACTVGPLYVAAMANSQAMVSYGGMPSIGCGPGGPLYIVNLTAKTAAPAPQGCSSPGAHVAASKDGEEVAVGGDIRLSVGGGLCIYHVTTGTYSSYSYPRPYGAAFSGDGQVAAFGFVFTDANADVIGRVALPTLFYPPTGPLGSGQPYLQDPQLNVAGSLYYVAYPNFVDIVDVLHGILRMRFGLSETATNTAAPIAIDSVGSSIFLITNKGLTIVDLGEAPLSIGSVNPGSASPGALVTVRGSGFDSLTTATVDGVSAPVNVTDPSTLTLTIPAVSSGRATIVLTNGDGTTYADSLQLTIQ